MDLLKQYRAVQSKLSETLALVDDATDNLPVTFKLYNTLGTTEFTLNVPVPEYVPPIEDNSGGNNSGNNTGGNSGTTNTTPIVFTDQPISRLYQQGTTMPLAADATDPIEIRYIDEDDATGDWQTGAVTVPPSVKSYRLQARYINDAQSMVTTDNAFYVGKLIALSGQSRINRFVGINTEPDGLTATAPFYHYIQMEDAGVNDPAVWRAFDATDPNFNGSGIIALHNAMRDHYNMAIGFCGYTKGNTAQAEWENLNSASSTKLAAVLDAVGTFDSFIHIQGTFDAIAGTALVTYKAQLNSMITWLRARYTHDHPIYIMPLGRAIGTINSKSYNVRQAQMDVITNTANVFQLVTGAGIDQVDNYHQSDAGNTRMGRRIAKQLNTDHAGPILSSAVRSGNNLRLNFTHTGGTQIINGGGTTLPANITIFYTSTANPAPVDTCTVIDATTLEITFTETIAAAQKFDIHLYYNADIGLNNVLHDNDIPQGDTVGMPLQAIFGKIKSS